jgi:DNA adenine methylase
MVTLPGLEPGTSLGSQSKDTLPDAKPFLKWAGGKQQLLAQYEAYLPSSFERYLEPFVGGGAVFFHLWNRGRLPKRAFLFDNNEELINTFRVVRDKIDELIGILAIHKKNHNKEYYYAIRGLDRHARPVALSEVERAARTIYLNKTCYNGLYRVNSQGQFNVPMGSYKNPKILYEDTLRAASAALQGAQLEARDFRTMVELAQVGDFFYFDPPYDPLTKTASFTSYTAGNFRDEDQRQLAGVFARLSAKGCLCMLSNSRTPFILDLYENFRIETVRANRAINSDADGRGSIKEVVVLNFVTTQARPDRFLKSPLGSPVFPFGTIFRPKRAPKNLSGLELRHQTE